MGVVMSDALDAGQTLEQRVGERLAGMPRAERRVAEYLRTHMQDVVFASAEDIAAATGTSDATVVRTAQALGYAGLLELKYLVGHEVLSTTRPSDRLRSRVRQIEAQPGSLLDRVFAEAHERLAETQRQLSESSVDATVELLHGSGHVLCYGLGPSESSAHYLALRLARLGHAARGTGATGFRLADDLLPLARSDVVVLFSPGRLLRELEVIIAHARSVEAHSILITDSLGAVLGTEVDVVLRAVHSPSGFTGEALSSLVVADALVLGLASREVSASTRRSELLTELRSKLIASDSRDYVSRPRRRKR
jgi:DNA-binding MurR/RpiR family transcriptional regulator